MKIEAEWLKRTRIQQVAAPCLPVGSGTNQRYKQIDGQIDNQRQLTKDIWTDRWTDRWTDMWSDRTDRQIEQTDRWTDMDRQNMAGYGQMKQREKEEQKKKGKLKRCDVCQKKETTKQN